jgi:hypothetical protein
MPVLVAYMKLFLIPRISFLYFIQHCFICRLSDPTVSEDAGIEPRTFATLAVRRSDHSARYHPELVTYSLKNMQNMKYEFLPVKT